MQFPPKSCFAFTSRLKLHIRIHSQTGNSYGFEASRDSPLLFQVEEDLRERFDRAVELTERVEAMS